MRWWNWDVIKFSLFFQLNYYLDAAKNKVEMNGMQEMSHIIRLKFILMNRNVLEKSDKNFINEAMKTRINENTEFFKRLRNVIIIKWNLYKRVKRQDQTNGYIFIIHDFSLVYIILSIPTEFTLPVKKIAINIL